VSIRKTHLQGLAVLLSVLLMHLGARPTQAQGRVKVNKDLITVSPPDADGTVMLRGGPGAIANPGNVMLRVENLATEQRVGVALHADGSFSVEVTANAGERVRVLARKRGGNQSIGTFVVPGPLESPTSVPLPPTESAIPPADPEILSPPSGLGASRDDRARLAVVLVVLDSDTGQILGSEYVAGPTRARFRVTALDGIAQQIIERCRAVVFRYLLPTPSSLGLGRPVKRKALPAPPGSTEAVDLPQPGLPHTPPETKPGAESEQNNAESLSRPSDD